MIVVGCSPRVMSAQLLDLSSWTPFPSLYPSSSSAFYQTSCDTSHHILIHRLPYLPSHLRPAGALSTCLPARESASAQQHWLRHLLGSMQVQHQPASGTTPHPAHTLTTGAILFLMLAGAMALPQAPSCRPCPSEHSPLELQRPLHVPQLQLPPRLLQVQHPLGVAQSAPPHSLAPCLPPHLPVPGPVLHSAQPLATLLQGPCQATSCQVTRLDPRHRKA